MNKYLIVALVALLGVGFFILRRSDTPAPALTQTPSASQTSSASPTSAAVPKTYTIAITGSGVSPQSIEIKAGDTVTFRNNDTAPHWPASGPHPTHTTCPGFDANRGLKQGETYSFTFATPKSCPFHDHLNSNTAFRGTITVR